MRALLPPNERETEPYLSLTFPDPPDARPHTVINMVCTLDGRIVNVQNAKGLGSATDKRLMERIRTQVDAVLIGAGTLRADPRMGYPLGLTRAVLSQSGQLPKDLSFFEEAPERAILYLASGDVPALPSGAEVVRVADATDAVRHLRRARGVRTLLVEGGSILNGHLIRAGYVDELFLTLAPKLRGGDGPTVITAPAFPSDALPRLRLLSVFEEEGELFLRYAFRHGTQPGAGPMT
ncbi:MAG: RibD family protein [Fimbriimonadia bacterium]